MKALMIYYFIIGSGMVCLVIGAQYQLNQDSEEIKAQEDFNRRAAEYYEDKGVEFSLYGEKLSGFKGPNSVLLRTSSG